MGLVFGCRITQAKLVPLPSLIPGLPTRPSLSRVGSRERATKFNFPQLDFVKPSSVFHPGTWERVKKCSNYALTNLLFGLCKFLWIIDLLVTHPSPHPWTLACPFTPEVLRTKESSPTPYPFDVSTFGFTIESFRELGGAFVGLFLDNKPYPLLMFFVWLLTYYLSWYLVKIIKWR